MDKTEKEMLLALLDKQAFYQSYVANLKSTNGSAQMKGNCPFHEDRNPSFSVNVKSGKFHCFGCGQEGDVFNFLERHEGLNFSAALNRIKQIVGVDSPAEAIKSQPAGEVQDAARNATTKKGRDPNYLEVEQIEALQKNLQKNKPALEKLQKNMG